MRPLPITPQTSFARSAHSSSGFAEENPHLVDLMYESELTSPALDPPFLRFSRSVTPAVRAAVAASMPGLDGEAADLRTLAFWSAIYGFASMRRKGVIRPMPAP